MFSPGGRAAAPHSSQTNDDVTVAAPLGGLHDGWKFAAPPRDRIRHDPTNQSEFPGPATDAGFKLRHELLTTFALKLITSPYSVPQSPIILRHCHLAEYFLRTHASYDGRCISVLLRTPDVERRFQLAPLKHPSSSTCAVPHANTFCGAPTNTQKKSRHADRSSKCIFVNMFNSPIRGLTFSILVVSRMRANALDRLMNDKNQFVCFTDVKQTRRALLSETACFLPL